MVNEILLEIIANGSGAIAMIEHKTGDRPSELLKRAIALFLPQMDAD
ncbi:hypothetical protein QUA81_30610 [Microcoleus sp. F6_B4]